VDVDVGGPCPTCGNTLLPHRRYPWDVLHCTTCGFECRRDRYVSPCYGLTCQAHHLLVARNLAVRSRATARQWLPVVHTHPDPETFLPAVNGGMTPAEASRTL
jgi:uncharacterized protein (DUF983 family)